LVYSRSDLRRRRTTNSGNCDTASLRNSAQTPVSIHIQLTDLLYALQTGQ